MNLKAIYRVVERDLVAQLRSRSFFVQSLVLPLMLTLVLGTALGGQRRIDPVPVGLVGPEDQVSSGLIATLEGTRVASVRMFGREEGEEAVRTGRLVALIELPDDARRALLRPSGEASVRVLADPASRERALVIEQVTRSYFAQLEAGRAAVLGVAQTLRPPDAATLGRIVERAQERVRESLSSQNVQLSSAVAGGRSEGLFAYYAIGFGVMCTLLSVTNGASGLLDEIERGTLTRLLGAPISPAMLMVAKFASLWAMAVVQLGLFVVATTALYGVDWGPFGPVVISVLATAAAAAGFGGIVIGLARSHEQVSVISLLFVLVMSLLGGSIWPVETLPGVAQSLSRLTYNRWAIESFQTLTIPGLGLRDILLDIVVLLLMGAIGLGFGAVRLSRWFRL